MKLLKISVSGLKLMQSKCEIDFLAAQRVTEESAEKMSFLFSNGKQNFYQNNVISFIGINASGKTTILKLITFVCKVLNNEPINNINCCEILDGIGDNDNAVFDIYFYSEKKVINCLHMVIGKRNEKFYIADEYVKSKPCERVTSKKTIYDFEKEKIILTRDSNEAFLLDDVSIMVAINKKNKESIVFIDMLRYTNINRLNLAEDCPLELITFFDPSIEYLNMTKKGKDADIRLKFKTQDEINLNRLSDVERYLSSGTIKGINTFLNAVKSFESGGYLIIDELENHFNREIVSTLIKFYMDKKVNPNGAVLLFSTHYPELLDEFERNDSIYIIRNRNGISAENLSAILKRNDIKKSEAYQSGYLEGTTPIYDSYMALRKNLISSHGEGK